MPYIVRNFDPQDPRDAERLAAMWNASDAGWPGGWTRGIPDTGERVRDRKRRHRRLAICVAADGDEIVGYCDLDATPGQTERAHVPTLNVRPDHHGKGAGRMLVREMVRRATELGYRQVTLGTWAGNTKAVPLYKKTGFFWVPETNVWMVNFIPTVVTLPATQSFFEGRDWYTCFDRELAVAPDDVRWKGMKVYPYRFQDGNAFVRVVIDAASEAVTALETPEFSVACSLPREEAPAGGSYPVTWEIEPRGDRPLEVVLLAEGSPGLELSLQERLVLTRPTTVTRDVRVAAELRPRRDGEPAYRVRSTLLVGGQPIQLETAVNVVRPVEIEYDGQALFPGRAEKVTVRLRSGLETPLTGRLAFDPHPAITCEPPARNVSLPPGSWTQCEFQVTAREPGTVPTRVRLEGEAVRVDRPVIFYVLGGGDAIAGIDAEYDERATLRTASLTATIRLRGGGLQLHHAGAGRGLMEQPLAELGPPFIEWRSRPPLYPTQIESGAWGTTLALTAASREFPGLIVERRVSLMGGDLARVEYRVLNTADQPQAAQLRLVTWPWLNGRIVLPTPAGLIREPLTWGEFPLPDTDDAFARGTALSESWAAGEEGVHPRRGGEVAYGLIWHPGPEVGTTWSHLPVLTFDLGELPPHSTRELPPVYLVGGPGDWQIVRSWWRRLVQPSEVVEEHRPEPVRVLEVCADARGGVPAPGLLTGAEGEIGLTVFNRRGRTLSGRMSLSGDAFRPEPAELAVESVDRDHPFTARVRLRSPAPTPGAGFLDAALDTGPSTTAFRVPIIRLGTEGKVRVSEPAAGEIQVENGFLSLRIAPAFLGSIVSLERGGVNHLYSSYPTAGPFVWQNPWFGGVHPFVGWTGNPRWTREKPSGEPVERVGRDGFRWDGVRVWCEPSHKELRWLRVEVEYLTLPGSNVVALVTRWINRTDARLDRNGGVAAWLQVGGRYEGAVSHWEWQGERRHRRRSDSQVDAPSGPWAAVENPSTGDVILLVTSSPSWSASIDDTRDAGAHLSAGGGIELPPSESREILTWLVLCEGTGQIDAYASLANLRELP